MPTTSGMCQDGVISHLEVEKPMHLATNYSDIWPLKIKPNSEITRGITFSHIIALLAGNRKTVLSLLQESFSAYLDKDIS